VAAINNICNHFLIAKFKDCNNPRSFQLTTPKELFIVEGKSAASTVQQAMHKPTQKVIALQGKFINAAKASSAKVLANQECQKLFQALDCGIGNDCNPERLAFSRVIILCDPDIDGAHARALILVLFNQYLRALIESGLVYTIVPPLYRVIKHQQAHRQYAWSQAEIDKLIGKNRNLSDTTISRFKGLAQFSSTECSQLLLDPNTRRQLQIAHKTHTISIATH